MTFLGDYLAGRAEPEQIHDHIDDWHDHPDFAVSLHTYLGMTLEQYAAWVERGELPERQPQP